MSYDYDVLFIGSGHSCNHGAIALKMAGKKVGMIEREKMGGTCTNFGCDAKILLDGPFEFNDALSRYEDLDIEKGKINWKKLMEYKKKHIGAFDPLLQGLFEKMGLDIIKGEGKIIDKHTIEVGGKNYTTEYIVIGTGCRDSKLDVEGKEFIHDSKDFLDIDEMPDSIVFIGAGIISLEFASMALELGKKVNIVVHGDKALRAYPQNYVDFIIKKMEGQGATFNWKEDITKIEKNGNKYVVNTSSGLKIETDYVIEATGRIANVENLGLDKLGIEYTNKGIKVNEYMQTSVENIYASGDVVDKKIPKLTPTAEFESNYIAYNILGINKNPIKYPAIPNLVFTLPRIAQVGVTIDEAKKDESKYKIVEVPFGQINEWVNNREKESHITYIFDNEGYLVGAAILSSEAGYMIDFLTLIINKKITATDLSQMIFSFPTQTYSIISGLIPILKK